jgi:hypothetical protein
MKSPIQSLLGKTAEQKYIASVSEISEKTSEASSLPTIKNITFSLILTLLNVKVQIINITSFNMEYDKQTLISQRDEALKQAKELQQKIEAIDKQLAQQSKPTEKSPIISITDLVHPGAELFIDQTVTVAGWIRSVRLQGAGTFAFVMLYDGSSVEPLQIVAKGEAAQTVKQQGLGIG